MFEALALLIVLGAVNQQITHIITVGVIFEEVRLWVRRRCGPKIGYLTTCFLCCGSWVGFILAAFTSREIVLVDDIATNFVLLGFAISLVGRVWNETLAILSSTVTNLRTTATA